jgi:hypothetical protein
MPQVGPLSFDECMARSWPGITDKEAFCAEMKRGGLQKRDVSVLMQIRKIDQEQRIAWGWVAITADGTGLPLIDADDHLIPTIELQKAIHEAVTDSGGAGKGGDLHEQRGILDVVDTIVITKELKEAPDSPFKEDAPEGWFVGFKVHDDSVWAKIKNGERPELSLKGQGLGMQL